MREYHGERRTRLYAIWSNMKARCLNPKNKAYANYGGRGITVSAEWARSFSAFKADMGEPAPGLSLERTDNNKGYCRENCIWATRSQQCRNRRSTRMLVIDGVTRSMVEWSEISSVSVKAIWSRVKAGWDPKEAVYAGPMPQKERIARAKERREREVPWCPASLAEEALPKRRERIDADTGEIMETA